MNGTSNQNYNPAMKPKALMCYICGREYLITIIILDMEQKVQKYISKLVKKSF